MESIHSTSLHDCITLAICSNRIEHIRKHWQSNIEALETKDHFLIIIDLEKTDEVEELSRELSRHNIKVIVNNFNCGLSYSRNLAIKYCQTRYIIFIDDDAIIYRNTINQIRKTLLEHYEVVGVKIVQPTDLSLPWYISPGQLHYLGIHNEDARPSTWGTCMAIDTEFVHLFGLSFREDLGRRGTALQSGDDTSFIKEMKKYGARESILESVYVVHDIDRKRVCLTYILRRSYWQGRSEYRRKNIIQGFRKEWLRYLSSKYTFSVRIGLGLFYSSSFLAGVIIELVSNVASLIRVKYS
jgi:glycosyltransferase involved in cell wall biosynthesis